MKFNSSLRFATLVAVTVVAVAACKKGSTVDNEFASEEGLLRYVPADTPYLLATGEPTPDEVRAKIKPMMDEALEAYRIVFQEIIQSVIAENRAGMSDEDIAMASTMLEELSTLLSMEGMQEAGIEPGAQLVVFGNGLLPVIRIEVADPAAFDAKIARLEAAAGTSMQTDTIDGNEYRYIGGDEGRVLLAVIDGSAVLTFAPDAIGEVGVGQLLGLTLPADNIAASNALVDIAAKYGYTEHFIGFVDGRRIASIFLDEPSGLNALILEAGEYGAGELTPVCRTEIREFVEIAPRFVAGYTELSTDRFDASAVIELREDLAAGLVPIVSPVPGLGSDPGGLLSFGLGFDLLKLREFYEARLDAIEADPYECEYFEDIMAGVAQGRMALQQPVPPVVYGIRGFNVVIDDAANLNMGAAAPPTDVDAGLVVATEDATTLIAAGSMFSPEIASLNLEPNGEAVALELPQLAALGMTAYAAMDDGALSLAVGEGAEARAASLLKAGGGDPAPFMGLSMDASRYYAMMAESMLNEPAPADEAGETLPLSPMARGALSESMLAIAALYDRMSFDVRFTEHGIELVSTSTLK